jgi:hypothetical protein
MTYGCVVHALIDAKLRAAYAVLVLATYLVMIRGMFNVPAGLVLTTLYLVMVRLPISARPTNYSK